MDDLIAATTHVVTGLQSGTPYVFLARGVNSNGVGIPSRVSSPVVTLGELRVNFTEHAQKQQFCIDIFKV